MKHLLPKLCPLKIIICVNVSVNYSTEKAYAEMSAVFSPNNFHGRGTYRKSFIKRPTVFFLFRTHLRGGA